VAKNRCEWATTLTLTTDYLRRCCRHWCPWFRDAVSWVLETWTSWDSVQMERRQLWGGRGW